MKCNECKIDMTRIGKNIWRCFECNIFTKQIGHKEYFANVIESLQNLPKTEELETRIKGLIEKLSSDDNDVECLYRFHYKNLQNFPI